MKTKNPFLKYRNPDPRCTYPFDPSPLGYCWQFATMVDQEEAVCKGKRPAILLIPDCGGCEMWKARKGKA